MKKIEECRWIIVTIVLTIIVICVIGLAIKLCAFEAQLEGLSNTVTQSKTATDYEQIIAFLKNEMSQYRDFIQHQEEFLITIVVMIGTVALTTLSFFGYQNRKDIKEHLRREFETELTGQIAAAVNDEKQLKYLREAVRREKLAGCRGILFAATEGEDMKKMENTRQFFAGSGFPVSKEVMVMTRKNIAKVIKNYKIIAFQVPSAEFEGNWQNNNGEKPIYHLLNEECKSVNKDYVLFVPGGGRINTGLIDTIRATTVNYVSKLRETLYILSYFSPE